MPFLVSLSYPPPPLRTHPSTPRMPPPRRPVPIVPPQLWRNCRSVAQIPGLSAAEKDRLRVRNFTFPSNRSQRTADALHARRRACASSRTGISTQQSDGTSSRSAFGWTSSPTYVLNPAYTCASLLTIISRTGVYRVPVSPRALCGRMARREGPALPALDLVVPPPPPHA